MRITFFDKPVFDVSEGTYASNHYFFGIWQAASPGLAIVCQVAVESRYAMEMVAFIVPMVQHPQLLCFYTDTPALVGKWLCGIPPYDPKFELAALRSFEKPLAGKNLTHVLWTEAYNCIWEAMGHA